MKLITIKLKSKFNMSHMRKRKNVFELEAKTTQSLLKIILSYPANIYLLKVNNGNTRTICEIC